MDSIDAYFLIDFLWAVMLGHMAIGLVWARVPTLSNLYVKTAAAYAAAAMENYSVALAGETGLGSEHLETCEKLARAGILRADASVDYYERQRKFFINMLWVTELRWTLECLRGIERLDKSAGGALGKRAREKPRT